MTGNSRPVVARELGPGDYVAGPHAPLACVLCGGAHVQGAQGVALAGEPLRLVRAAVAVRRYYLEAYGTPRALDVCDACAPVLRDALASTVKKTRARV